MGDRIHYVWTAYDGTGIQLYWGRTDIDGSGWTSHKITSGSLNKENVRFQVVGDTLYLAWDQKDGSGSIHIWTGTMNTDGTGLTAVQRTEGARTDQYPEMQVADDRIHYVWRRETAGTGQLGTGISGKDGTGWTETVRTSDSKNKFWPELQVADARIYYVWCTVIHPHDFQVHLGRMNMDGTGWTVLKVRTPTSRRGFPGYRS